MAHREHRPFAVSDDELDAPDGAMVDGFVRSGNQWVPMKSREAAALGAPCEWCAGSCDHECECECHWLDTNLLPEGEHG